MSSVAAVRPPAPALPWQHATTTIIERKNSLRCEIKVRLLVLPIVAISTPTITRYHKPLPEASRIWPTPRNFTGQFLAKKARAPGRLKCTCTVQVSPRHVSDHKSRYLNSSDFHPQRYKRQHTREITGAWDATVTLVRVANRGLLKFPRGLLVERTTGKPSSCECLPSCLPKTRIPEMDL